MTDRKWRQVNAGQLLVGDIVFIAENTRCPADLLLVESGIGGGTHVFVDTKALDGYTAAARVYLSVSGLPAERRI